MLTVGTKLGPYEIVSALGAGGMGEVYRARDTRLNRMVAIKVLPPTLAADPEYRERFEREARSISALEHPHICPLYDVGEHDGVAYLVMQYLDGETLAARLARGPLPLAEALTIATQITSALDRAHRQGIVHRDVKPGNIFLASDGPTGLTTASDTTGSHTLKRQGTATVTARLLDFGLAKQDALAASGRLAVPVISAPAPTAAAPLTTPGMVLGTVQYMAPEQIEGDEADARTDIFALGVVLYEMLTGRRAFDGKSQASLLGAILRERPAPVSAVTTYARPALDYVIDRCLAKAPDDRWQTARDLMAALEWIASGADLSMNPPQELPARRRWLVTAVVVAAAVALTAAAAWIVLRPLPQAQPPLVRFTVIPDGAARVHRYAGAGLAVSPDGRVIVYVAQPLGQPLIQLYRRDIDGTAPQPIRGTEGGFAPFFSPDSNWIAFFTDEHLLKMPVTGGPPTVICAKGNYSRGTWAPDDTIVLGYSAASGSGPLSRVPASGGTPVPLTTLGDKERLHQHPQMLPDGQHVLFAMRVEDRSLVAVADLATGRHRVLFDGNDVRFVPPATLVYAREEEVFAIPFDVGRLETTGAPVPVSGEITTLSVGPLPFMLLAADRHGTIVYARKRSEASRFVWMDTSGRRVPLPIQPGVYAESRLSPDGTRLAVATTDAGRGGRALWVLDLAKGTRLRLTRAASSLRWTRDARAIVFSRNGTIYRVAADASGDEQELLKGGETRYAPLDWTPDGASLLISMAAVSRGALDRQIGIFAPGSAPRMLINSSADETQAVVSPDGRWLAYVSNVSDRQEVYLRAFSGAGATMPVSNAGGRLPMWAADSRTLFFVEGTQLRRVSIASTGGAEAPAPVADLPEGLEAIEMARDGRFLLVHPAGAHNDAIDVVLNWGAHSNRTDANR